MSATIKDIAKAAGVSINTVSRALNGKPDVSSRTRERVLRIARQLNYSPNYLARGLISRRTRTLGVIVTDNANPFYARVIKGIEDVAHERGYNIILCNTNEDPEREAEALRLLREKRVDGILITPVQRGRGYISELRGINIPFVLLNRHSKVAKTDYVINDNVYGARLAVGRLIGIGRRRIAYIGGPPSISSVRERLEGCHRALRDGRLSPRDLIVKHTNLKMEDGYLSMKRLLDLPSPPTGVFAYSDLLAIGVMRAILEVGFRIPEDIALVGYDDIEYAGFLEIPLTTVRQPRYRIGKEAASVLIDKLEGKGSEEVRRIVLRPELIVRESA